MSELKNVTRVLLRTATPTLARGFTALGKERDDIDVFVCGSDLGVFLDEAERLQPSAVLLDTSTQVDFACLTELRKRRPGTSVVLWTDSISVEVAHHAKAAGVRGVLRKDASEEIVVRCLHTVAAGDLWFERSLLNSLLEVREVRLSPRERQLLRLVAQGLSNKLLASELMISEGTVKVYLAKLFRKVGVHDRYELALHGLRSLGLAIPAGSGDTAMNFTSYLVLGGGSQQVGH